VGLLLGVVLAAVTGLGGGDERARVVVSASPSPSPVPSPTPTESGPTITVPAECAEGLERARDVLAQIPGALEALRNLDTARLQEILDRVQRLQPEVNRLAAQCRARVGG